MITSQIDGRPKLILILSLVVAFLIIFINLPIFKSFSEGVTYPKITSEETKIDSYTNSSSYSLSMWVYINDWNDKLGQNKIICKRDLGENISNPEISLDAYKNKLNIKYYTTTSPSSSTVSGTNSSNLLDSVNLVMKDLTTNITATTSYLNNEASSINTADKTTIDGLNTKLKRVADTFVSNATLVNVLNNKTNATVLNNYYTLITDNTNGYSSIIGTPTTSAGSTPNATKYITDCVNCLLRTKQFLTTIENRINLHKKAYLVSSDNVFEYSTVPSSSPTEVLLSKMQERTTFLLGKCDAANFSTSSTQTYVTARSKLKLLSDILIKIDTIKLNCDINPFSTSNLVI